MKPIPWVLIVDDGMAARGTRVGLKGRLLVDIDLVDTPAKALEVMKTKDYAAFILDGHLGGGQMWGPELLDAFRAEDRPMNRDTPVCFLSGETAEDLTAKAKDGRLQGPLFMKGSPVDWARLQEWLVEHAGVSRRSQETEPVRQTGT